MFRRKTKARLKFNVNTKWKITARGYKRTQDTVDEQSKALNLFKIRRQIKNDPRAT